MVPQQNERFEALYQEQYPKLFLYAKNCLADRSWAQDVVHDVFYEALRQADELEGHANPGGWLMRTLQNKIADNNRAHLRYIRHFLSLDTEGMEQTAAYGTDEVEESISEIMRKVMRVLNENEFYLLRQLVLERRSHAEVAHELGISVWNCEKRLERVRKKLYEVFPERKKKKVRLKRK